MEAPKEVQEATAMAVTTLMREEEEIQNKKTDLVTHKEGERGKKEGET